MSLGQRRTLSPRMTALFPVLVPCERYILRTCIAGWARFGRTGCEAAAHHLNSFRLRLSMLAAAMAGAGRESPEVGPEHPGEVHAWI
jgi:hypothetical protein